MADATDIKNAANAAQGLQSNIEKAQSMADFFFQQASKSTGAIKQNLDKVAGIYSSLAKNTTKQLELEKDLFALDEKRKKLYEDIEKLKKDDPKKVKDLMALKQKEIDQTNEQIAQQNEKLGTVKKEVEARKKVVDEINNQTTALGKFFESGKAKLAAYLLSTERLMQAVKGFTQAARDVTDISIQSGSFLGMTGNIGHDFLTTGKAAFEYGTQLSFAETKLGLLGIKSEEVRDSFKEFSKITPFAGQAEQLNVLTTAIGAISKELGVSLSEATEFTTQSTLKFNRTAAQTAQTLYDVKESTMTTNQELGRTIIVGRDVTKMLFDLARESTAGAQDQDVLAKTITTNMVNLQAQGNTLDQSTRATKTYIEAMTTNAPDWARWLAGPELVKQTRNMTGAMKQELESAQPGIVQRIQDIQNSAAAPIEKQMQIQKMLEGTRLGLQAMGDQVDKFIFDRQGKVKEGAALAIQGLYGITDPLLQQQFIQTRQMEHDASDRMKKYNEENKNSTDANAKYFLEHQDDLHDKIMGDLKKEYTAKIANNDAATKIEKEAQIKKLKDQIKGLAVGTDARIAAEKKLKGYTGEGLAEKGKQALAEQTGGGLAANPGQMVINFLQSPTGALLTGLLGIGSLLANSLVQTGLLAKIAATSVSSLPGMGLKAVGGLVRGAGGLVKSGVGAAGSALGAEASAATVGGAATTLGAAAIAGAVGYEVGKHYINPWLDKFTFMDKTNKAGQTSGFSERNIAKFMTLLPKAIGGITSKQYHETYDEAAATPVAEVNPEATATPVAEVNPGITGTAVANVPTAPPTPPPTPPGVTAGGTSGSTAAGAAGAAGVTKVELLSTARGTNIKVTPAPYIIPTAEAHAANMTHAARYGGG